MKATPAEAVVSLKHIKIEGRLITTAQITVMMLLYELGELTTHEIGKLGGIRKPVAIVTKLQAESIIKPTQKYKHGTGYILSSEWRLKLNQIYGV